MRDTVTEPECNKEKTRDGDGRELDEDTVGILERFWTQVTLSLDLDLIKDLDLVSSDSSFLFPTRPPRVSAICRLVWNPVKADALSTAGIKGAKSERLFLVRIAVEMPFGFQEV